MIYKLFALLILATPITGLSAGAEKTLLISLFFGATPPAVQTSSQPGNQYSLGAKDNRLIEVKTLNKHSARVEFTTREFTAALYQSLAYQSIVPAIAISESENVSGFQVQPVITGHGIQIDIDAEFGRSSTEQRTRRVQTSVLVKQGKWVLLTGEVDNTNTTDHLYRTNVASDDDIWIKASRID